VALEYFDRVLARSFAYVKNQQTNRSITDQFNLHLFVLYITKFEVLQTCCKFKQFVLYLKPGKDLAEEFLEYDHFVEKAKDIHAGK
jgi:hypothetical protein